MPAAPLLRRDEIERRLAELDGWQLKHDRLVKTFRLTDFRSALEFVNQVADPADQLNHHPDVAIHWNEVELSLWTHAAGGLTERDISLARAIDRLDRAR